MDGIQCSTVVDGAINADVFEAFLEQVLLPELREGDVVVLDDLSSHKRARTRQLIESPGADLTFLPALQPRPESDRDAVRQGQAVAALAGLSDT